MTELEGKYGMTNEDLVMFPVGSNIDDGNGNVIFKVVAHKPRMDNKWNLVVEDLREEKRNDR